MDTETIERLLTRDATTSPHFKGVYSRDTLPVKRSIGIYIVNEDRSSQGGSHWIAIHITPRGERNIYFDSYGRKAEHEEFKHFLGRSYAHNKKRLQHMLSTSCGQWCMYFVWRRCEGWTTNDITRAFKPKKLLINDYVVNYLVEKKFKTDQHVIDKQFIKSQICKQMKEVLLEKKRGN